MAMLAVAAIAAGILPACNGRRAGNGMAAHQLVSLPYCMVTIFSNSFAELISSLD